MTNKKPILFTGLPVILALGIIAAYIGIYHILPYSSIRPYRITRAEIIHRYPVPPGLRLMPFTTIVEDTITLKGYFVPGQPDSVHGTVILLHGIASVKESMFQIADTLARHGYNSIVFDLRAHGESGGIDCTFGYFEKYDVSAVIDEAKKRFGTIDPVAVYGNSLGAAVAIQAMARDPRIRCGIAESPFATLREVVYDYWKHMSGLPLHWIPDEALRESEKIAHFHVDEVAPEESARQIRCPVLIAHGTDDPKISIVYGERIYHHLGGSGNVWYPIAGGTHINLSVAGGEAYRRTLLTFLHQNLHQ
jgi:uncharacterized protein